MTTDGTGVVSHAGTVLLAELADRIGLTALLSEATDGLRERRAGHDPGRVLIDVAVAIADGAVTISDIQALADHEGLHGRDGRVDLDDLAGPGRHQRGHVGADPAGPCRGS